MGVKFRHQVPYGNYITDFMSLKNKLIIELDGYQHYKESALKEDEDRDEYFKNEGFTVLSFTIAEVTENIDGVLEVIWQKSFNPKGI
jgi:very-short-patch-repair endonuclease